jgi:hypothetical protein
MTMKLSVRLYANEDGLGPAIGIYYVVKGLVEAFRDDERFREHQLDLAVQCTRVRDTKNACAVLLRNNGFPPPIAPGETRVLEDAPSRIRLALINKSGGFSLGKKQGTLSKQDTKNNLQRWLEGLDGEGGEIEREKQEIRGQMSGNAQTFAVVSFGAPTALHAASQAGVQHLIEVFDHAWSHTLAKIFAEDQLDPPVGAAIERLEEMERCAGHVYLFPEYLCPSQYYAYWAGRVKSVIRIPGVLGGLPEVFVTRDGSGQNQGELANPPGGRDAHKTETKDRPFEPSKISTGKLVEARRLARGAARAWLTEQLRMWDEELFGTGAPPLDLDTLTQLVLVQGGDTPVWEGYLARLIQSLREAEQRGALHYSVLFSHNAADRAWSNYMQARGRTAKTTLAEFLSGSVRIRTLDNKFFPDFQSVYWAADMIYSRGGGITANDAVATMTPLTVVEELGHWQTEQIRELCSLAGFSHTVSLRTFFEAEYGVISMYLFKEHAGMVEAMGRQKSHQELWLGRQILDQLLPPPQPQPVIPGRPTI